MRKISSHPSKEKFIQNLKRKDYLDKFEIDSELREIFEKKEFQNDPEIVLQFLKSEQINRNLKKLIKEIYNEKISENLKTNKNFVLEATEYSEIPFLFLYGERHPLLFLYGERHPLAEDSDILLKASEHYPELLQKVPPEKITKKNILNIVKKNGMALKFLSSEFQDDEEIVLQAVTQNGNSFEYVSDRLKGNKTIVLVAIQNTKYAIELIYSNLTRKMKNDLDIVREMIKKEYFYRLYLPKKYEENVELGLLALQQDLLGNFESLPISLKEDRNFILSTFKENPEMFNSDISISPKLKNDEDFILKLIEISPKGFYFADKVNLKTNFDFVEKALSVDSRIIEYGVSKDILYQIQKRKNKTNEESLKIKVGGFTITFLKKIRKSDLKDILNFKKNLFKAIIKVNNSKVPNFSSILNGSIVTGEYRVLTKLYPTLDATAKWTGNQIISYYGAKTPNSYLVFIHELGHKYHDTLSFQTKFEIEKLYKTATNKKLCKMVKKPQIGDPLSNLISVLEGIDWNVGNSEFDTNNYFIRMYGSVVGFVFKGMRGKDFLYENEENGVQKTISSTEFATWSKCPSEYGATNQQEFVAEMCTLITMDIVKPQQKEIANKFIEIVKKG